VTKPVSSTPPPDAVTECQVSVVTRTPYLVAFEVTARGPVRRQLVVDPLAEAACWRDRAIHRLTCAAVATDEEARRVFQGVGLVVAAHAAAARGRLTITPQTAGRVWGVAAVRGQDGRPVILVQVGAGAHPLDIDAAIVTLEVER
jgi:hypothetical protein